ncbi:MAG: hypothetical protein J5601_01690, partial [Elusimicrobiaceae bacterium]|nr:hypothetical protein [Elusimicrobiaceae bacterium]
MKKAILLCMCIGLALPMFAQERPQEMEHVKTQQFPQLEYHQEPMMNHLEILPQLENHQEPMMDHLEIIPMFSNPVNRARMEALWVAEGGHLLTASEMIVLGTLCGVGDIMTTSMEKFIQSEELLPVQKAALYALTETLLDT